MLGRDIHVKLYTDSRGLYEYLVRTKKPTEKSLLIDLSLLRQPYKRHEIDEIIWIRSTQTTADGFAR